MCKSGQDLTVYGITAHPDHYGKTAGEIVDIEVAAGRLDAYEAIEIDLALAATPLYKRPLSGNNNH